jgi:hypothetical protein
MKSPLALVNQNPARRGESVQGYALRVLKLAMQSWTGEYYDQCRRIAETEAAKHQHQPTAADALSNVIIDITQLKLMTQEAMNLK